MNEIKEDHCQHVRLRIHVTPERFLLLSVCPWMYICIAHLLKASWQDGE